MTGKKDSLIIGVLVNPYAGIGGSVALKGSDGPETRTEALRRGATPMAASRMSRALQVVAARPGAVRLLTWGGELSLIHI